MRNRPLPDRQLTAIQKRNTQAKDRHGTYWLSAATTAQQDRDLLLTEVQRLRSRTAPWHELINAAAYRIGLAGALFAGLIVLGHLAGVL